MDWIEEPQSNHYDWQLLQTRINEIIEDRKLENDRKSTTFALRLAQSRNIGDMGNAKVTSFYEPLIFFLFYLLLYIRKQLYRKARVGTKKIISDYTDKVIEQLNWIGDTDADEEDGDMTLKERHDYFMTLRQSYGRTALLLSGGGTLGIYKYIFLLLSQ